MKYNRIVMQAVSAMLVVLPVPSVLADVPIDSFLLREAVTVEGMLNHLGHLQAIAQAHHGHRMSGTSGYDHSVKYIEDQLLNKGYQVTRQVFDFPYFEETDLPILEQVSPFFVSYPPYDLAHDLAGFVTMEYSGSDDVQEIVEPVDLIIPPGEAPNTSTSGCETEDFNGFTPGHIALIQRGSCPFLTKAQNAQNAGAAGVIIFNEGQEGRTDAFLGTLQQPIFHIPVVGASFAIGEELFNLSLVSQVIVHMRVEAISEMRLTYNVIGETPAGRDDRVVIAGAHLDSVSQGPGINDNGSGVAALLEIASQMSELNIIPRNKVRFAFWGSEEFGLLGSQHYVSQLSEGEIKNIALNLNLDMIASSNFVRFVYDGDGSDGGLSGPNGSGNIEKVFLDYFKSQGLPALPTAFDGRSDYGPFIDVGIPAGGLFTGAEEIKTVEQAIIFGGTVEVPCDSYYHTSEDDLAHITHPSSSSITALDQMSDAAAHAVLTFAMTKSAVNGTAKASTHALNAMEYRGPRLQK